MFDIIQQNEQCQMQKTVRKHTYATIYLRHNNYVPGQCTLGFMEPKS
jgi:hypothetical protein